VVLSAEFGAMLDIGQEIIGVPATRGFRVEQQEQQCVTQDCGEQSGRCI